MTIVITVVGSQFLSIHCYGHYILLVPKLCQGVLFVNSLLWPLYTPCPKAVPRCSVLYNSQKNAGHLATVIGRFHCTHTDNPGILTTSFTNISFVDWLAVRRGVVESQA